MNIQDAKITGTVTQMSNHITNIDSITKQVRAIQAEADRTLNPVIDNTIDMGQLEYSTIEGWREHWEQEYGFNAQLNALDYNNLSAGDRNRLVSAATWRVLTADTLDNRRSLNEMVSFIEEQLNAINNNPEISDERRAVERSLWEDGFVSALSMYRNLQRADSGDTSMIVADRASADSNAQSAMHFALGVMQNVESLSSNTDIQNLIIRGMEGLVERETHASVQANFKFMLTNRENEGSARTARDAMRGSLQEMFETLRSQMENNERNFPLLLQNIDTRA